MKSLMYLLSLPANNNVITLLYMASVGFGVYHWTESAVSSAAAVLFTMIYSVSIIARTVSVDLEMISPTLERYFILGYNKAVKDIEIVKEETGGDH